MENHLKKVYFFTKDGYCFRRFNCNRELISDGWRSYRESTFANIELRFWNNFVLEMDDLNDGYVCESDRSEFEDWRPHLGSLLQPIPFPYE